jgi:hypothetical protein
VTEAARTNPLGNYRFLGREGRPFSDGIVADQGHDLVHARFASPVPLDAGLSAAVRHVTTTGRPVQSIAGFELRIPEPFSPHDFAAFNDGYIARLKAVGLDVEGLIPTARTNVAPHAGRVTEPSVHAVSYTVPSRRTQAAFVMSGVPEEEPSDFAAMMDSILRVLSGRMKDIGAAWKNATEIQFYGEEGPGDLLVERLIRHAGAAAAAGVHWFPSRPPVVGLSFEIDVRSAGMELVLG